MILISSGSFKKCHEISDILENVFLCWVKTTMGTERTDHLSLKKGRPLFI